MFTLDFIKKNPHFINVFFEIELKFDCGKSELDKYAITPLGSECVSRLDYVSKRMGGVGCGLGC